MKEEHYYTGYNGMSVPNGYTYEYVEYVLDNGRYKTFDITYKNGDGDTAILVDKINETTYQFKRKWNGKLFNVRIASIHLIKEVIQK